jgi:hypothetical protein
VRRRRPETQQIAAKFNNMTTPSAAKPTLSGTWNRLGSVRIFWPTLTVDGEI